MQSALFEFVPVVQVRNPAPQTLLAHELETGQDYAVVLTNTAGLIRYRLDDVVRVRGWVGQAPVLEFLYRAGGVSSVAGEKLTENQCVEAVRQTCLRMGIPQFDFVLAPCWGDPPYYRLSCEAVPSEHLAAMLDDALGQQNEEYASRRSSGRLGTLQIRPLPVGAIQAMDRRLLATRNSTPEQYKRPALLTNPGEDDTALGLSS